MENSFSLLGNVEGDASAFLERLAAEAKANDQKQKRNAQQFVRAENREGKGGQSGGSWRSGTNNGQQSSYQHDNRVSNGYKQNNGVMNGHQRSSGSADAYKRNNGGGNGYRQGYGRRDGGASERGRVLVRAPNGHNGAEKKSQIVEGDRPNGHNGAEKKSQIVEGDRPNGHNGAEKKSQIVEGDQQVENQEQGGDTGGAWEKVTKKQQRNGNSSYRGGRGRNGGGRYGGQGGRGGSNYNGNGYGENNSGAKEASGSSENHSTNGDNDIGNVAAATQVPKDDAQDHSGKKVEDEQAEEARENVKEETEEEKRIRIQKEKEKKEEEEEREARRKDWEEEQKKKTLRQYEEQLLKNRKVLKTEERKATLDKDFESMQLVGKKKEDGLSINKDAENGKLKKKVDKVKVRKSVSIDEFLKPAKVENRGRGPGDRANGDRIPRPAGGKEGVGNFDRRGGPADGGSSRRGSFQGRGGGEYQRGTSSRQATDGANGDRLPQPGVGKEQAANFDRRGGGGGRGGFTKGSSADPGVVDAPSKEPVKPPVPVPSIDDPSQFPHLGAPTVK